MWTVFLSFIGKVKWSPLKISIGINVILGIIIYFLFSGNEPEEIIVIKDHYIDVPAISGESDTIKKPEPYKIKNSLNNELLIKYNEAKSEIERLELYKESVIEREYKEVFKDSVQEIEIFTRVQQGRILEQAINYKIDPYLLKVRDTLRINPKDFLRNKFLGGIELGMPLEPQIDMPNIIAKGTIYFQNKKDNILSLGIDTRKTIWAGYIIKFN